MSNRNTPRRACGCGSTDFYVEEYERHRAECRDGFMQITKSWVKRDALRFVCARCSQRHAFRAFNTDRLCQLLES